MKKMILAIVALMMSATMMAQEGEKQMPKKKPADKTEMVKQRTDMMVERYGLDEKQAEKVARNRKWLLDIMTYIPRSVERINI